MQRLEEGITRAENETSKTQDAEMTKEPREEEEESSMLENDMSKSDRAGEDLESSGEEDGAADHDGDDMDEDTALENNVGIGGGRKDMHVETCNLEEENASEEGKVEAEATLQATTT